MMRGERGFSLVELMVAVTITLIVSAAIYGLLSTGSRAFRREPEIAERQQNIRVAMDLISRDVYNAGTSLPTFAQVFARVDPGGACVGAEGLNGCGPEGSLGPVAAGSRAGGDPSTRSDVLEIVSTDETCPVRSACRGTPAVAGTVVLRGLLPSCFGLPGLVLLTDDASFTIQPGAVGTGSEACPGGDERQNGRVQLGPALAPWVPAATMAQPASGPPPQTPMLLLYGARVVRYRIAPSVDPGDSAPALWRSTSGRFTATGSAVPEPGEAGFTAAGSNWEVVARGIEDLQVEYQAGADPRAWGNRPPAVVAGAWDSLVRQVRITLSARVTQPGLSGETAADGAGPNAVRGQLTTVVAPRTAFNELQMQGLIK